MATENQTLKEYNEAQKLLETKTEQFAEKTFDVSQLPQLLKEKIKGRIDPKLRSAQRTLEAEFYAAPAKYRSVFGDVENPLVRERLSQEASAGVLKQLNNIRDLRSQRETEVLDIITDISNTAQAGLAKEEILLGAASNKVSRRWTEYRESVRQREKAAQEARLRSQNSQAKSTERLNALIKTQSELNNKLTESIEAGGEGMDTNEFLKIRKEWAEEWGADNLGEFDEFIDPAKYNNIADANNLALLNQSGLGEQVEDTINEDLITIKQDVNEVMASLDRQGEVFDESRVLQELFSIFPELKTLLDESNEKDLKNYMLRQGGSFSNFQSSEELGL